VPRELLLTLTVAAVYSEDGPRNLQIGAVFPPSVSQLARIRLKSLCRQIIRSYSPPPAPSFSTPPSGGATTAHTGIQNQQAYEAQLARQEFREALCQIMDSDDIFSLTPLEARQELLELRELLRTLPSEGISR
jgi:hypothetical protein